MIMFQKQKRAVCVRQPFEFLVVVVSNPSHPRLPVRVLFLNKNEEQADKKDSNKKDVGRNHLVNVFAKVF